MSGRHHWKPIFWVCGAIENVRSSTLRGSDRGICTSLAELQWLASAAEHSACGANTCGLPRSWGRLFLSTRDPRQVPSRFRPVQPTLVLRTADANGRAVALVRARRRCGDLSVPLASNLSPPHFRSHQPQPGKGRNRSVRTLRCWWIRSRNHFETYQQDSFCFGVAETRNGIG